MVAALLALLAGWRIGSGKQQLLSTACVGARAAWCTPEVAASLKKAVPASSSSSDSSSAGHSSASCCWAYLAPYCSGWLCHRLPPGAGGLAGGIFRSSIRSSSGDGCIGCLTAAAAAAGCGGHSQHSFHSSSSSTKPTNGWKAIRPQQLTARITQCDSPQQLLQLLQQHAAAMNRIHLSAAFNRLAKLRQTAADHATVQQLLGQLEQLLMPQLDKCGVRELSNIAWACSKLQHTRTALFAACMTRFLQQHEQNDHPQAISIMLWAAANSSYELEHQQVQQLLATFTSHKLLREANPQNVSNTLWAVATMQQPLPEQQLEQLLAALVSKLHQAKPQELSNTLWAIATKGQRLPEQQLQLLLAALVSKLHQAKPQELSNTLWAIATMQQPLPEQQLEQLLAALVSKLQQATPQSVSNTLWAVATMQQPLPEQQLQLLLAALVSKLQQATPQSVSNTLWAVATMQQPLPEQQLEQLLAALVSKLHQAKPQELSNTLWACAKLQYLPQQLLLALEQQAQWPRLLPEMTAQELGNTAWALGQLGHADQQLHAQLLQQAVQRLQQQATGDSARWAALGLQALCNFSWSVAVLDLRQHTEQLLVLMRACRQEWGSMAAEGLRQLYQVHVWLLDDCHLPGAEQGLQGVLTAQQLQQCEAAWRQALASTVSQPASRFQRDVFAVLQQLPLKWQQPPQLEQLCEPDGVLSVDITAVTAAGVQLALEADGPSHFRQPDGGLMGTTLFGNRALAARGYTVVSVPYMEWDRLRGQQQKQLWLLERIEKAFAAHYSAAPLM